MTTGSRVWVGNRILRAIPQKDGGCQVCGIHGKRLAFITVPKADKDGTMKIRTCRKCQDLITKPPTTTPHGE